MHGKILVKMVHKINRDTKMICCKLTYFNQKSSIRKVNRVHSVLFLDQKTIRVLLSKNVENVGATELIKDETKITLKRR